jgi:hypothetical protein
MSSLYTFESGHRKLDELGYPQIDSSEKVQVFKTDFRGALKNKNIRFDTNGIYLKRNGIERPGYIYIKNYDITYDGSTKFPTFHLTKCEVIEEFILCGMLNDRYEWSNDKTVNLIDRRTKKKHNGIRLALCKRCSKIIKSRIDDTEMFFSEVVSLAVNNKTADIGINGYVKGWGKISRWYRESQNWTCENCGIQRREKGHSRWWHTHHISGNKWENETYNLQCLCECCHATVDELHNKNWSKSRLKFKLKSFIKIYKTELEKRNSPCLKQDYFIQ